MGEDLARSAEGARGVRRDRDAVELPPADGETTPVVRPFPVVVEDGSFRVPPREYSTIGAPEPQRSAA